MYKSWQMTWISINECLTLRFGYCKANTCLRHMWHLISEMTLSHCHRTGFKTGPDGFRQHNTWTKMCLWVYECQKTANMLWAYKSKFSSFYSYFLSLIHCSSLYNINSSLLVIGCTLQNFLHKLLMLRRQNEIKLYFPLFWLGCSKNSLVPAVKSLFLGFHPLSEIVPCVK